MKRRFSLAVGVLLSGLTVAWACGFDNSLREYLNFQFWLPFAKVPEQFVRPDLKRASEPYAGMLRPQTASPLQKLRTAYQEIASGETSLSAQSSARLSQALNDVRADRTLSGQDREELFLIDAKFDLRHGSLDSAQRKLQEFVRTAKSPAYLSEARGWLGRIHYLRGEQSAAGKIYLDELNRARSNLSQKTLVDSLRLTYGYDGGPELLHHLEDYFDTPEHAVFAIHLATNPHWKRDYSGPLEHTEPELAAPLPYQQIKTLLARHSDLLQSKKGANLLALLAMRTALRAADPSAALRIAAEIPADASVRENPDFEWMLASGHFLTGNYSAAQAPLLRLFQSPVATAKQRSAAAYALCGVYQKLKNPVEQIRYALWLHTNLGRDSAYAGEPTSIADQSIYLAVSGWDLALLLDAEAPINALRTFLSRHRPTEDVVIVKYALAVHLARENRYAEAAQLYRAIGAPERSARMLKINELYQDAYRGSLGGVQLLRARYRFAEYLGSNPERIYFNDRIWNRSQNFALFAPRDSRLNSQERISLTAKERKLRDDQEERWRAYQILQDVLRQSGKNELGREAARLSLMILPRISPRFGREEEIQAAEAKLIAYLKS